MPNQNNPEKSIFYDQADGKMKTTIQNVGGIAPRVEDKSSKAVKADPDEQVRATEDASLQDESYSFDESNTDNEEYHDADDVEDFDNEEDFLS